MKRQYLMMDERAMMDFDDAEVLEACLGEWDAWEAVHDWASSNGVLFAAPEGATPAMVGFAPFLAANETIGSFRRHAKSVWRGAVDGAH